MTAADVFIFWDAIAATIKEVLGRFRSVTEVTNEVTLKNKGLEPKDLASTS
ncbi:hypothetical protein M422DRAFT_248467 [Sphaerobolus stellatus SS14]|uniref:Uncharacterized protein n=1 Tax=Sphaerobolus stellatus (strain SS14) TaxID=990650 RepID=A0A0C9UW29_SPHS4|nr:hypothetical protein M422DRAFT_248467 [Sphaerobolus stellatus SS14]